MAKNLVGPQTLQIRGEANGEEVGVDSEEEEEEDLVVSDLAVVEEANEEADPGIVHHL